MSMATGELISEVSNRAPNHEVFEFGSIQEGLQTSGTYVLQYELQPSLPGQPPLASCTRVNISAGPPVTLELQVCSFTVAVLSRCQVLPFAQLTCPPHHCVYPIILSTAHQPDAASLERITHWQLLLCL